MTPNHLDFHKLTYKTRRRFSSP